jgi:hypothetical protein
VPRTATPNAVRAAAATAALAFAAGCSDTFTPASAAHADQMLEAYATRFAPNVYDARYNTARVKLAESALVPSRIFDDSSVWTAYPSGTSRALNLAGALAADGKYHFDTRASLPPITRVGESRHTIALERVASNQFRWNTRVDLGSGDITPDEVATALEALLRAPEGRAEHTLRAEYRAAFPRATAAFGRGFQLDSVAVGMPGLAGGATTVLLRFAFDPESMKASFPKLADYLDKYLGPAKYHFTLTDRAGAQLFDVVGRDRAMTVRYRLAQGKLVTLLGPPRPWPDSLSLLADLSLKVKFFTVGFHELNTDFVISNTTSGNVHERGWTIVAQREPKWDLPLITERLIRSPLRHPFEGEGSSFRLLVRDSAGGPTLFGRRTRLQVQESAIMRFLGSLASRAIGDLDERVEQEEYRFLREGLTAMQADLRAIARRPRE